MHKRVGQEFTAEAREGKIDVQSRLAVVHDSQRLLLVREGSGRSDLSDALDVTVVIRVADGLSGNPCIEVSLRVFKWDLNEQHRARLVSAE